MTIADTAAPPLPSFGILARFREAFRLAFRLRPGIFIGFNLLVLFAVPMAGLGLVFLVAPVAGEAPGEFSPFHWVIVFVLLVGALMWMLAGGVMAMAGCDAMAAERRPLGFYLRHTAKRLHVILVLGLLVAAAVAVGSVLIGILGLWAAAVYSVFMPALLWDEAGWGAMGRSRRLTKEYRWPIVGLLLLAFFAFLSVFVVLMLVADMMGPQAEIVGAVLSTLLQLVSIPVFGALPAVIHARLREVKEGGGTAELRAVFE